MIEENTDNSIETPRFDYAEKTILATILNSDFDSKGEYLPLIFSKLNEDHFFSPMRKNLFNYFKELDRKGERYDTTKIATDAYTNPLKFGTTADLVEYQTHVMAYSLSQLKEYISILILGKTKRIMFKQSERLLETSVRGEESEVKRLLSEVEKELMEMQAESSATGSIGSPKSILEKIVEDWQETTKGLSGYSYGSRQIDNLTDGMQQGVSVFCGLPSEGKSVLMMQACVNPILDRKNVIIFEMDMPDKDVMKRLSCLISGVDISSFKKGAERSVGDLKSMKDSFRMLAESDNLEIYDTIFLMEDIEAKVEDFKRRRGSVDLIVVDYWQLIETTDKLDETRTMNKTSKALKALTQKHKCPLITGAQVNENGDTKDSKQIQADCVFQAVIRKSTDSDQMGLYIKKNRGGQKNLFLPQRLNGLKQKFEKYYTQNMLDAARLGKISIPSGAQIGDTIYDGWRYDLETHKYRNKN